MVIVKIFTVRSVKTVATALKAEWSLLNKYCWKVVTKFKLLFLSDSLTEFLFNCFYFKLFSIAYPYLSYYKMPVCSTNISIPVCTAYTAYWQAVFSYLCKYVWINEM